MTLSFLSSEATVHQSPPTAPSPAPPPVATGLLREWRLPLQVVRAVARAPQLARVPRGGGRQVIDIPGWKAPEASMAPLRAYLRWLGYDATGWGLGVNTGDPERDAPILSERVAALFEQTGEKTALVGWSLGGVIARETARAVPHAVSRVITYGTPAIGGPTYTVGADSYGQAESSRIRAAIEISTAPTRSKSRSLRSSPAGTASWTGLLVSIAPRPRSSTWRFGPPTREWGSILTCGRSSQPVSRDDRVPEVPGLSRIAVQWCRDDRTTGRRPHGRLGVTKDS